MVAVGSVEGLNLGILLEKEKIGQFQLLMVVVEGYDDRLSHRFESPAYLASCSGCVLRV
jgi:hypothetical protein